MHSLFTDTQKALLPLPPRRDTEAEITASWDFPGGLLNLAGQEFIFPDGVHSWASARWFEESLLAVNIGVSAVIDSECARCLKPVSLEISGELGYLYYPRKAGEPDELDEYMTVEANLSGRVIDVMPQIQESIYTLIPTKILCREDCKGLCPECGADLNEGSCSCKRENIDPRLEALRNFTAGQ